jgi:phosphate transport system substrate-binding protein
MGNTRKFGVVLSSILALAVLVAFVPVAAAEDLTIVGTGDGVMVLKSIGDSYSLQNPDVAVHVPKSIGSGGGVKAVGNDKYALGRVARGIKDKEKHFGLSYVPYAKVPVSIVVNQSVPVDNLTSQQVLGIFSGKITNWSQVGGKDAKIRVIRREDGDSSLKVLKKQFPGWKNITLTDRAKTAKSTPENYQILSTKADTIGFGPHDVSMMSNVKCLSIDGKHPLDKGYPAIGTMGLIYKESKRRGYIDGFINFATSDAAHKAIERAGGIPIK